MTSAFIPISLQIAKSSVIFSFSFSSIVILAPKDIWTSPEKGEQILASKEEANEDSE